MNRPIATAIAACSAYLLGSIPTAVLVSRAKGIDIYSVGSGNPGASNVSRALGRGWAVFVFTVDAAKGAVPVAISRFGLDLAWGAAGLVGLASVLGHTWPVTTGFKGGRGVATGGGVLVVLQPLVAVVAGAVWAILAKVTRKASVASLVALAVAVSGVLLLGRSWSERVVVATIAAVVALRHAPNIKRLLAGEELSLGDAAEGAGRDVAVEAGGAGLGREDEGR